MFRRRRNPSDFAAEIEAHLALEAERFRRDGLSPADAASAARRAFGNATIAGEQFYEGGRWLWWDEAGQDLIYALRTLRQNPVFTAAAVMTLALGIGANTAIFSFIDMVILRPLPYPNPDRIVALYPGTGSTSALSPATFLDYRRQAGSFEYLAAFREEPFNLTRDDRAERIEGASVTPDFFAVFGVQARVGRTLTATLDAPGSTRTVVLSDALWRRLYGGNPDVLGKTVEMDGEPLTIVGVMPPSFQYPPGCAAWRPARHRVPEQPLRPDVDQSNSRDAHYFSTIGRLRPGIALAKARTEAETIAVRLKQQYGDDEEMDHASLVTLQNDLVGDTRPALLVLLGAVSLLLLIACANVANILLARGATRRKEIAIRAALGAGRARLVRQFLTESLTLGVAGGALGVLIAYFGLTPLSALLPADLVPGMAVRLDARVLAFTAVLSVGSAILFGLFPALQAVGFDLNGVLKEGARGSVGARAGHVRSMLVVSEVALAGVLLIGAGLLLRSFSRLLAVNEGFVPEHVLSLQLSLSNARYPAAAGRARFVRQVLDRMTTTPGVASAAVISRLPLNPGNSTRNLDIKGRVTPPGGELGPDYLVVSPDYFRAMSIPVLRGRAFTERDDPLSAPVVIVNQAAARHFWPGQDPVGQFVTVGACGNENQWCQVVGVVDDVRQHGLDRDARPAVFVPYARDPWPFMAFVVRTELEPGSLASAMEGAVHAIDREQPVYNVRAMRDIVSQSLSPRKLRMLLIGSFACLALILACVGIYGVMAYSVVQRMQEIGIRIALGAGRGDVLRVVVGHALKLALAGVAAGAILSLVLTRFLSGMLYGIQPTDAATFAGVSALLVVTALVASSVPALRAARVDPLASLRAQ
ncbi:MAG TPA: ABC transporter permease [Bryobacteraceae bacterium]